jgi:GNAT superfamily N-acetyltransferase
VVTDYSVFAYLCDVFVDSDHRNRGVGKALMQAIMNHEDLTLMRRWVLCTKDAHGLYEHTGFGALATPEIFMERFHPDTYEREATNER